MSNQIYMFVGPKSSDRNDNKLGPTNIGWKPHGRGIEYKTSLKSDKFKEEEHLCDYYILFDDVEDLGQLDESLTKSVEWLAQKYAYDFLPETYNGNVNAAKGDVDQIPVDIRRKISGIIQGIIPLPKHETGLNGIFDARERADLIIEKMRSGKYPVEWVDKHKVNRFKKIQVRTKTSVNDAQKITDNAIDDPATAKEELENGRPALISYKQTEENGRKDQTVVDGNTRVVGYQEVPFISEMRCCFVPESDFGETEKQIEEVQELVGTLLNPQPAVAKNEMTTDDIKKNIIKDIYRQRERGLDILKDEHKETCERELKKKWKGTLPNLKKLAGAIKSAKNDLLKNQNAKLLGKTIREYTDSNINDIEDHFLVNNSDGWCVGHGTYNDLKHAQVVGYALRRMKTTNTKKCRYFLYATNVNQYIDCTKQNWHINCLDLLENLKDDIKIEIVLLPAFKEDNVSVDGLDDKIIKFCA